MRLALTCAAMMIAAAPAQADVKNGVEAWARGDYRAAVDSWRPLAIVGDADAQFDLAQAYKLGRGVDPDLGQAEQWYRKAAMQGHERAADNYGLTLFQRGLYADALPWLEKSAARGEPRAQLVLGTMLFNGDGVAKDWVRAYALLTRSSAAGLASGSATLAQMDRHIPLETRQRGIALARRYEEDQARAIARAEIAVPTAGVAAVRAPVATKPASVAASPAGAWRVQFGAFREEQGARTLWRTVQPHVAALTPFFVPGTGVTRLQAGPIASGADARAVCAAVQAKLPKTACMPVSRQ